MQTYKLSKNRVNDIKAILKFKAKKDILKKLPQLGYIYSSGENLIVSDGVCLGAVRTSEYEKGFYELNPPGTILIPAPDEIQSMSFLETILPMLEEIKEVELADFVCPTSFCKILEELSGTWINPEYYLKMPPGDYEIGRFRLFKSGKTDLGSCPVIFQNEVFTFIIMPLSH